MSNTARTAELRLSPVRGHPRPARPNFADTVVVPGLNLRSHFTDTEEVDDAVTEQSDGDASRFCPSCHRVYPSIELVCSADGTELVLLPPPAGS
jgi:hypothetical protein